LARDCYSIDKTVIMKKSILASLLMVFIGCNSSVEKPKNLISKDKMIDVLYDLSLLQAIKTQNISGGINTKESNEYIFKKYKIDSVQLAQSNKYYASDMEEYKNIFAAVKAKLEEQTKKNGGTVISNSTAVNPDTPQVQ
jgi:hypothetical protein